MKEISLIDNDGWSIPIASTVSLSARTNQPRSGVDIYESRGCGNSNHRKPRSGDSSDHQPQMRRQQSFGSLLPFHGLFWLGRRLLWVGTTPLGAVAVPRLGLPLFYGFDSCRYMASTAF